jgi:hypothetical protein
MGKLMLEQDRPCLVAVNQHVDPYTHTAQEYEGLFKRREELIYFSIRLL